MSTPTINVIIPSHLLSMNNGTRHTEFEPGTVRTFRESESQILEWA